MIAPCGERMTMAEWMRHMIKCRACMIFAAQKKVGER
jgi:hypothetical protein